MREKWIIEVSGSDIIFGVIFNAGSVVFCGPRASLIEAHKLMKSLEYPASMDNVIISGNRFKHTAVLTKKQRELLRGIMKAAAGRRVEKLGRLCR